MTPQYFILAIYSGTELALRGPYTDRAAFEAQAQHVRDHQDRGEDSIFALELKDGKLTPIDAPGTDYPDQIV
jgi:hypothetical protein